MSALRLLSSMATKSVLGDLVTPGHLPDLPPVEAEAAGGVAVARRIWDGEEADLVVLASGAIAHLADEGRLHPSSVRALFSSEAHIGVRVGWPGPETSTVLGLQEAMRRSSSIGYSTGPSGDALLSLLAEWGMVDELRPRLVQAQPGVPVSRLITKGEVDLGVQQRSELEGERGVRVTPMPPGAEIVTVFSGAVVTSSPHRSRAAAALALLSGLHAEDIVRKHGFNPL